ncbi:winged helix-turn-helix domain-containing protein [Candidatus Pelagibacter sp.]|nr:winged helix-turn-helix domain-containing protein [Candidatus Pelagibacter sp.]
MKDSKIVFYDCNEVYKIFKELNDIYKFNLDCIYNKQDLDLITKGTNNYLIVANKYLEGENINNQIILNNLPININKFIEKINVSLLKNNFLNTSSIKVGKYTIDMNARKIFFNKKSIKLTEQEIKILDYLKNSSKPVSVIELQEKLWGYSNDLETHTVETHIYRLRQKVLKVFKDNDFLLSLKNGYSIKI